MWHYFKCDKKAIICLVFICLLIGLSIGNTVFNNGEIRKVSILFDENGQVMAAPFPPSLKFLLGTDRKGYDLLHLIIEGAKWTIGAALLISSLRIILGLFIGIGIGRIPKKIYKYIEAFVDSFTVVPMTTIAYFLLSNVLVFANGSTPDPFYQRVAFQVMILIVLAIPTVAIYLSNEIKLLMTEEFVSASHVLGGTRKHVLIKHISPHMIPVLIILFMQQFVQVLVILVHLGILQVFFGGTIVFFGGEIDSVTHEWSGLLGMYYKSLLVHPWVPLVPMFFFAITIICSNFILKGIENAYEKVKLKYKTNDYSGDKTGSTQTNTHHEPFVFTNNRT